MGWIIQDTTKLFQFFHWLICCVWPDVVMQKQNPLGKYLMSCFIKFFKDKTLYNFYTKYTKLLKLFTRTLLFIDNNYFLFLLHKHWLTMKFWQLLGLTPNLTEVWHDELKMVLLTGSNYWQQNLMKREWIS